MTIWRISDGKPGHDAQSLGLTRALAALTATQVYELRAPATFLATAGLLRPASRYAEELPDPDLIIGAGHGTHLPLLCAARTRGGRSVVLMRPSVPCAWFNLCLIPEHDGAVSRGNIIATRGALNTVTPSATRTPDQGMILIGGPSRHYHWNEQELAGQLGCILAGTGIDWTLTDSPRTPPATRQMLAGLRYHNLSYRSCADTPRGWLSKELATAVCAWVTEDSVSMVYEALTAGAATGILSVPAKHSNKITASIRKLAAEGMVTPYSDWLAGRKLTAPGMPFNEAARCARLVLGYFALPVQ